MTSIFWSTLYEADFRKMKVLHPFIAPSSLSRHSVVIRITSAGYGVVISWFRPVPPFLKYQAAVQRAWTMIDIYVCALPSFALEILYFQHASMHVVSPYGKRWFAFPCLALSRLPLSPSSTLSLQMLHDYPYRVPLGISAQSKLWRRRGKFVCVCHRLLIKQPHPLTFTCCNT